MTERLLGTGRSAPVTACQCCGGGGLVSELFLGFLPPVNTMAPVGSRPAEQASYPAEVLRCPACGLVQLGLIVDPRIVFPPDYAYTSGTTKILRENFARLAAEVPEVVRLAPTDLVVDIGSNDGTLLSNFHGRHKTLGVEPTGAHKHAVAKGIPTVNEFFTRELAGRLAKEHGRARLVTAANVFAHIEDVHGVVDGILELLAPDGVFVNESHYLPSLLETLQYDTVYHEHLRYYSLTSLKALLERHGLEPVHAVPIPTHGGSIRVYAARQGVLPPRPSVAAILKAEEASLSPQAFAEFRRRVSLSKMALHALLWGLKKDGKRVYAVGAPSRAATLVNYVGLDETVVECVLEVPGSSKVGKYLPGTRIPVVDEKRLFDDPPDAALLLSWHIADELVPKLRAKGFKGSFVVPLPEPRLVPPG